MRNRVIAFIALASVLAAAFVVPRVGDAVAGTAFFRVDTFRLEGARFLTLEEALEAADVPEGASVWDDTAPLEAALAEHPMVAGARIRRRPPGTLVLEVSEREPVALVPTPTLEAVDAEGRILPVDPSMHGLDLPLLRTSAPRPDSGWESALASEIDRLRRIDPDFVARTSELVRDERGDLTARWSDPQVTFRFRAAVPGWRLREGQLVLADATERTQRGRGPVVIDLRFADQVVVGRRP